MKHLLFILVLVTSGLSSSLGEFDFWLESHYNQITNEFKGAQISSASHEDGSYSRCYDVTYYNRKIATILTGGEEAENLKKFGIMNVEYFGRNRNHTTIEDLMSSPWNDKKFRFIYGKSTGKAMKKWMDKAPVHTMIKNDKVDGKIPWMVTFLQSYLEGAGGSSSLTKYYNHFGIKCAAHSKETHQKWADAAGSNHRLAINSRGDTTCVFVGGDDYPYDHYKVFSSDEEGMDYHAKVLNKKRYSWFRSIPFDDQYRAFTVQMYGADVDAPFRWKNGVKYIKVRGDWKKTKKIYYYGQELTHGKTYWFTGIDCWFVGLSASGYATDPYYADKLSLRYFTHFNWDLEKYRQVEDLELGLHYPEENRRYLASINK